jgi:type IV pilus assembly protein PilY1
LIKVVCMFSRLNRLQIIVASAAITLLAASPAFADDTEIFVNQAAAQGVRPNILLVIDTSGSMSSIVADGKLPYDYTKSYAGACDMNALYWRKGGGSPPTCSSTSKVLIETNKCDTATRSLNGMGGLWTGRLAQWNVAQAQWRNLNATNAGEPLECEEDAGTHGTDAGSVNKYARNGDNGNRWTSDSDNKIGWGSIDVHTLYTANWLNWYHGAPDSTEVTRLQTLQAVSATLAYSVSGVNIGVMRYSNNDQNSDTDAGAEGGMVTYPVSNIATSRQGIVEQVNSFKPGGYTPITETLYEAGQYLAGKSVDYGVNSRSDKATPFPSVPSSRSSSNQAVYQSPIQSQCQRNYVVMLTDGAPRFDSGADSKIAQLRGAACDGSGDGHCLDDMAEYLAGADLSSRLNGPQSALTYAVGFGDDVEDWSFLQEAARAGGGKAFVANDLSGLTSAIQEILGEILQRSSTFTTPSVAINALNRTQTIDELYVSVFRPEDSLHWPGNLKKYGLQSGRIVDAQGRDAVEAATGFFKQGSRSFWSTVPDDDRADAGGAASQLPDPQQRKLYTYLDSVGNKTLTAAANRLDVSNDRLTDALLGTGGANPSREDVLNWARGIDVQDVDGDGNMRETHRFMGDPLHARPTIVTYGGSTVDPSPEDSVIFTPTNDGYLHAVNAKTGREMWAFVPSELIARLVDLYRDPVVSARSYGLDGDVRVLRFDSNQNGIIESSAGDKVWIYFGMRRGGRFYYALDVTDRNNPQLLWKLGPDALPGVGETWSTPALTRVRVGGETQNGEKFVLIMGGGYDDAQENYNYTTDTSGHRIFMVDAATGNLLWYAGGPGGAGSPSLALEKMTHSIPGRVVVLDTNGDQFADRLYAADMGGRIWRFDISNGESADNLVTGGVLAALGAAETASTSITDTRRFYYAPDVALIQRRGADPYYNLAIGSGYRGHPLHKDTHDRFYSIRDKSPFSKFSQSDYDNLTPVKESDLVDITPNIANPTVSTDARGWKLELSLNGGWVGEKVLAEALTANGVILFPTYQPVPPSEENPCVPNGLNRVYALSVDTGKPAVDFNGDKTLNAADVSTKLSQTGIAGEVSLLFESSLAANGNIGGDAEAGSGTINNGTLGSDGRDALGRRALCMVGVEVLNKCVLPGGVVRTFWQHAPPQAPE